MGIKIALAGNPNCGKTTLFNALTGSNQYVGNWPGVTVEKKEGKLKGAQEVIVQDLPGIYSLSPYTLEEVVARDYLLNESPDTILNVVDATNIERNLYLSTQLAELRIPMLVALNMSDVSRKNGDIIQCRKLGEALGCEVVETSALKGEGHQEAAMKAVALAEKNLLPKRPDVFTGSVKQAIEEIEALLAQYGEPSGEFSDSVNVGQGVNATNTARLSRWYAIKLFERDEKTLQALRLPSPILDAAEKITARCERELDDDSESLVTNQRYAFVSKLVSACVKKGKPKGALTVSDQIDRIVTSRWLALPLFIVVMWLVYYISVSSVGALVTDFTNDVVIGEWVQAPVVGWLTAIGCADWLVGLIGDGIIGGVGAVIGFLPQLLVLFLMLAMLEDVGYMARVAFIMDRMFRKFGLSGKSFIPMLISSGCGVPGVMAARTIESERDRRMTIMTATFIPCGAKLPMIGLVAGALFHNAGWVATAAYFIGMAAVIVSGVILKKTRAFAGQPAPFVMELPAYHAPSAKNVLRSVWERGSSFVRRAGSVVVIASILIWFTSGYGWVSVSGEAAQAIGGVATQNGVPAALPTDEIDEEQSSKAFGAVEDMDDSILGKVGDILAPAFEPLGFGTWQSTVATVMGLIAKEEVVGVFGVLYGVVDDQGEDAAAALLGEEDAGRMEAGLSPIASAFHESGKGHGALAAFSFLVFNLLCAPCFAAIGAIRREMNSAKWTWFAIGYQCAFAYTVALIVYQLGSLFAGEAFGAATMAAFALLTLLIWMLARRSPHQRSMNRKTAVRA